MSVTFIYTTKKYSNKKVKVIDNLNKEENEE